MREIKFRAYNKITAEMKYNIPLSVSGDYGLDDVFRLIGSEENKVSLMQYTGLKDKNGKEIYEGDIILNECMDDQTYKYEIKFEDGCFMQSGHDFRECLYEYDPYFIEVVGNIYETRT